MHGSNGRRRFNLRLHGQTERVRCKGNADEGALRWMYSGLGGGGVVCKMARGDGDWHVLYARLVWKNRQDVTSMKATISEPSSGKFRAVLVSSESELELVARRRAEWHLAKSCLLASEALPLFNLPLSSLFSPVPLLVSFLICHPLTGVSVFLLLSCPSVSFLCKSAMRSC